MVASFHWRETLLCVIVEPNLQSVQCGRGEDTNHMGPPMLDRSIRSREVPAREIKESKSTLRA
jgi:hypothetical protein